MAITKKEIFTNHVLRLIHSKGFKAMTMRDIADEMNCDVANIYNYTSSKNQLLEDLLFDISDAFHTQADQIIQSQLEAEEKVRAIVHLHVTLISTRPYEVALLINEWRNLEGEKLNVFNKRRKQYEIKISKLVKEGIEQDVFRAVDPSIIAGSILGSLRWLYDKFAASKTKLNPFDVEKEIAAFILSGIKN